MAPGQQRWHQIGKGLAGASARLHHQFAAEVESLRHRLRHAQLRGPRPVARNGASQLAVGSEKVT